GTLSVRRQICTRLFGDRLVQAFRLRLDRDDRRPVRGRCHEPPDRRRIPAGEIAKSMLANSETRYGTVAVTLHWLIALIIIGMLILGTYMADLPRDDPSRFDLIQLHKSIGITVIVLSVARLLWRLVNRVPPLPAHMPAWEKFAAHASHALL